MICSYKIFVLNLGQKSNRHEKANLFNYALRLFYCIREDNIVCL